MRFMRRDELTKSSHPPAKHFASNRAAASWHSDRRSVCHHNRVESGKLKELPDLHLRSLHRLLLDAVIPGSRANVCDSLSARLLFEALVEGSEERGGMLPDLGS